MADADFSEILDAWEAMQRRREYRVAAWRALVEADSAETGAEADDELPPGRSYLDA